MPKAVIDGFGRSNADIEPLDPSPDISQNVQQTLARLMVWDYTNHQFKLVASDIDGRLIISMSGVQINTAQHGAVFPVAGAFNIRPANVNRRYLVLYNNTGNILYIGFTAGVTAANGFMFMPGTVYTDNIYTGEYWGIQPLFAGDIRFMEF